MPDPAIIPEASTKGGPDKNMHKGDSMLRHRTAERRYYGDKIRFPLRDSEGVLVLADRRLQPDRRLGNIEVEWLENRRSEIFGK